MYAIVVQGKAGAMSVRYASATEALKKYREMEAEGVINIDLRNAIGEPVGAFDLEHVAKEEAENVPGS